MSVLTGLIAAALLGADGTPSQEPPVSIVYRVTFLDMEGLEWRTSCYTKLQPISRQESATIWSAPEDVLPKLVGKAEKVIAAPTIRALAQAPAAVLDTITQTVLTDIKLPSENPVSRASFSTMKETFTKTRVGVSLTVRGRKIDQGVLACITISDKQVIAMHPVTLTSFDVVAPPTGAGSAGSPNSIKATIQVPEMSQCEVAGEWLIPTDGVLIVSMGVHTLANSSGKAVVRERLALIQASQASAKAETRALHQPKALPPTEATRTKGFMNTPITMTTTTIPLPTASRPYLHVPVPLFDPAKPTPIPLPAVPSRALPEGRDANGEPIPLPPLPEIAPVTTLPGSSAPCATPQSRPVPMEESDKVATCEYAEMANCGMGLHAILPGVAQAVESMVKRDASIAAASKSCCDDLCCDDELACCETAPPPPTPMTFSFRLPFQEGIDLEIKATAKPVPSTPKPD